MARIHHRVRHVGLPARMSTGGIAGIDDSGYGGILTRTGTEAAPLVGIGAYSAGEAVAAVERRAAVGRGRSTTSRCGSARLAARRVGLSAADDLIAIAALDEGGAVCRRGRGIGRGLGVDDDEAAQEKGDEATHTE